MWLPPRIAARPLVKDRSLADLLERVLDRGVVVDGDVRGLCRRALAALDVLLAKVPIVGAREIPHSRVRRRLRRTTRRKSKKRE
jgi:gas vesicle protein GvpA/GvpJ/GvpM family